MSKTPIVDTIDAFLRSIDQHSTKSAEATSETGGHDGSTTHPSAQVDDGSKPADIGSRASENASDVKDQVGKPSVDSTSETINVGQDAAQMNIGTRQSFTGEDASIETGSAKSTKDDGGTRDGETSHPARTDNSELDGKKYANLRAKIDELTKIGSALVARIAAEAGAPLPAKRAEEGMTGEDKKDDNTPEPEKAPTAEDDLEAGKCAAEFVGVSKDAEAMQQTVFLSLAETIQDARRLAEKVASVLPALEQRLKGAADDEPPAEEEEEAPAEPPAEEPPAEEPPAEEPPMGDAPPAGPPVPGAEGQDDGSQQALIEALLGAGDQMPGGLPPEAGGMPEGGMPGGEPGGMPGGLEGAGGPPMGPEAGPAGGGELSPEDLQMLAAALEQAGVSPEQWEAAASARAASQVKSAGVQKSNWRPKTAEEGRRLQEAVKYLKELCHKD